MSHDILDAAGLDRARAKTILGDALKGADDGELFVEYCVSESFAFDDGRLKAATFDTMQGMGLRAVCGEVTGYAHSSDISEEALKRAAATVAAVKSGHGGVFADAPRRTNVKLYGDSSPLDSAPFEAKVKLLQDIDAYARGKDARVRQVSASLTGEYQIVEVLRPDGQVVKDIRPLPTRLMNRSRRSSRLRSMKTTSTSASARPPAPSSSEPR